MPDVLRLFDYPGKDLEIATDPDPLVAGPAASPFEHGQEPGPVPRLSSRQVRGS